MTVGLLMEGGIVVVFVGLGEKGVGGGWGRVLGDLVRWSPVRWREDDGDLCRLCHAVGYLSMLVR